MAGEKLAPVIVEGLRNFITDKERKAAAAKGFERIEVTFHDGDAHGLLKKRAFYGRWAFPMSKPAEAFDEDRDEYHYYAVALTAKGAIVIINWSADPSGESYRNSRVYDSLETAAKDPMVNWPAIRATEELGVPTEELEI